MRRLGFASLVAALISGLFCAATAGAQAVRGVVVDRADVPVQGVVVQILDASSRVAGRARLMSAASSASRWRQARTASIHCASGFVPPTRLR